MAVTYQTPIAASGFSFLLKFSTDRTPPINWRVYRNGVKIKDYTSNSTSDELLVFAPPDEGVAVEVLDLSAAIAAPAFPGHITLNWLAFSDAAKYRIDEYVSGSWISRQTITTKGEAVFQWLTRFLENQTTHTFRVVPIGDDDNEGATALTFTVPMVRQDVVPDVDYSYSAGTTKVTISDAA